MIYRPSSGAKIKINAANPEKGLAARVFGIPDWSRTNGLSLRRRPLYPTELPGHIQKLFNFPPLQETNELPLRRRTLYPGELRGHIHAIVPKKLWNVNSRGDIFSRNGHILEGVRQRGDEILCGNGMKNARIWMICCLRRRTAAPAKDSPILAKMPGFFCGTSLHNGLFRL